MSPQHARFYVQQFPARIQFWYDPSLRLWTGYKEGYKHFGAADYLAPAILKGMDVDSFNKWLDMLEDPK
jgi:hypothetical protein